MTTAAAAAGVLATRIKPGQHIAKSVIDAVLAAAGLMMLAPLLVLVALAIQIDSPGPILFRPHHTGLNGQMCRILKFRSMMTHAGLAQAIRWYPRVTRVGCWLRRTSIDELRQLLNVLRGEMPLVGPRPQATAHDAYHATPVTHYMQRFTVKPGLTGWAQIKNARGETDSIEKIARRVTLDLAYLRNWAIWLALRILAITPLRLLTARNAY